MTRDECMLSRGRAVRYVGDAIGYLKGHTGRPQPPGMPDGAASSLSSNMSSMAAMLGGTFEFWPDDPELATRLKNRGVNNCYMIRAANLELVGHDYHVRWE